MKQQIKKWGLRLTVTGGFLCGILLTIVLNPALAYAHKTTQGNFSIYHNNALDPSFAAKLAQADNLLKSSAFYDDKLDLEICLNDGAAYPGIIETIRGRAFAWGFYNKLVLQGNMNSAENYVELSGYKWNLTQLLAHEMTHCLQFEHLGLFHSKPLADIPNWKWEGYAEFVSRQNAGQKDLVKNITRLEQSDKNAWSVTFEDNTITPREYYNAWTMVQYCMLVKKMTYPQLLEDQTSEVSVKTEMMDWYTKQH